MKRKKGDTSRTCGSAEDLRRKLVENFLATLTVHGDSTDARSSTGYGPNTPGSILRR